MHDSASIVSAGIASVRGFYWFRTTSAPLVACVGFELVKGSRGNKVVKLELRDSSGESACSLPPEHAWLEIGFQVNISNGSKAA
jgi:hypothetical protein